MVITASLQTANCAQNLGKATQNILENAFYIAKQKLELSRKAYKKLIKEWGWEGEDKKYLQVAKTFKKFSPSDLAEIEPNTLFLLSNQSKKYAFVIEQILDMGRITQQKVRELIKQQRKPKPFKPEKPSIWKIAKDGKRYCQVPPIHDQGAGVALQRMMDEEGLTAQQIIAEALELRQAMKEGRLNVNVEYQNQATEEIQESHLEVVEMNEFIENQSQQIIYEDISDEPTFEIYNSQAKEDYAVFSDSIIINPGIQETVEFLSSELFTVIENINVFGGNQIQQIKQLVADTINLCNEQPVSQQWNILAEITRRDTEVLELVVKCSGEEHAEWIFNLPQLLADAALENPEELEWVNKRLRSQAMLLISTR